MDRLLIGDDNKVLVVENITDIGRMSVDDLKQYAFLLTNDPMTYWHFSKAGLKVFSLDDFASTRTIEKECGARAQSITDQICAQHEACLEFSHFEIKKIIDPFVLYNQYAKRIVAFFPEAIFHLFLNSDVNLEKRFFSENERLLSHLISEHAAKVEAKSVPKKRPLYKAFFKSLLKCQLSVGMFLSEVIKANILPRPIVLKGVLGRGLEKELEGPLVSRVSIVDLAAPFEVSEFLGPILAKSKRNLKLSTKIVRILEAHQLNHMIVNQFLAAKICSLKFEQKVFSCFIKLLPMARVSAFISMKTSSFLERLTCSFVQRNSAKVVTFTHLAEGYYDNEIVEYIDYISSDVKVIPARKAKQDKIYAKYKGCQLLESRNALFARAKSLSHHTGSGVVFVAYTYPKTNFIMAHYRALGVEQFKIHWEWIKRVASEGGTTINFRLYPNQVEQRLLIERLCDDYSLKPLFHDGDFQETLSKFDQITLDNFCTSFAEAICMNKNVIVVNTVFEINDDVLAMASDHGSFSVLDKFEYPLFTFRTNAPKRHKFEKEYLLSGKKINLQEVLGFG